VYCNFHRHSFWSNIIISDSTVSQEDYAIRAKELGHKLLSSVEHGYPGRYIESYELAKKYDLKYLFGVEAYWVKDRFEKDRTNSHINILARTEVGRKAINRVLAEANLSGFYYRPRLDLDLIFSLPKNDIWISSSCIAFWKYEDIDDIVMQLHEHFDQNFFLEVQYHNTESQKAINKKALDLSNHHGIPIIFGADSHYINLKQSKDRDDYLLSKNVRYEDEDGWYMDYCDDQTAVQRFIDQGILSHNQIHEAIENTNTFLQVEEYDSEIFNKNVKLPTLYPKKTQEEKDKLFSELVWQKWEEEKDNVPEKSHNKYEEEIKKELDVIIETKMSDYFLLNYEIIKRGKDIGGNITLTGRGSAPSFFLCKLLGFTTVDRISATVKLFPERFITKERILEAGSLPDIDFNLGNPEVFAQAQIDVLGEDCSYPMLSYGTLKPKAAWKLYARAKYVDFATANTISEQIDEYEMALKHLDEDDKDSLNVLDFINPDYQKLYLESAKYLGIVSDAKVSPCGFILLNKNIKEEIGIIKIKEHICSLMDILWAEQYHFLKNDLLKVSVVDLIYKVYKKIGINPHPFPELLKICHNVEKVWAIYKNAWTMGINQVEQTSTKGRVAKYAPTNISELSAFVAAIRPGFKSMYKQFESREPFSYGIESLDKLIQTKEFPQSYMLYQENAMQVMAYAGILIAITYEVIKNVAKKRAEKIFEYKKQFLQGMVSKIKKAEKITEDKSSEIATKTWQIIEDSSRYIFNASHAYCVAGDSLYGAYLKSHYPLQFYEVFLTLLEEDGDKDRLSETKFESTKAFGIKFPPYRFGQDNRKILAQLKTNEIISSLTSIKGFSSSIGRNMYELGQNHYDNFIQFLIDAEEQNMLSAKLEELIKINYFENFGYNKKLYNFYKEFTSGKSRYLRTHTDKTKTKRVDELKVIWENLSNERFPIITQIMNEQEILGNVTSIYPNLDKRYVYVLQLNEKYAPRIQIYCLSNGNQASLKIEKKVFQNNNFLAGDILYLKHFKKKNSVKYENNQYVDIENEYQWWIVNYDIIAPNYFDKIVEKIE
jgi:DNA polymerase III alpha subunit